MHNGPHHPCHVCGSCSYRWVADHYFRLGPDKSKLTSLWRCRQCGLIERLGLKDSDLEAHYDRVGYLAVDRAGIMWRRRSEWFRWIRTQLEKRLPDHRRCLLDVGCSYGHMLTVFSETGWVVQGLEPDKKCVVHAQESGLCVTLGALPDTRVDASFDAVTFVDSFYYSVSRPLEVLREANRLLSSGGVLFMRLINRTHLIRAYVIYARVTRKSLLLPNPIVGDVMMCYSPRTIGRLLELAGFTDIEFQAETGKGKKDVSRGRKALYMALHLIDIVSFGKIILSPGLMVWGRKP